MKESDMKKEKEGALLRIEEERSVELSTVESARKLLIFLPEVNWSVIRNEIVGIRHVLLEDSDEVVIIFNIHQISRDLWRGSVELKQNEKGVAMRDLKQMAKATLFKSERSASLAVAKLKRIMSLVN